MHCFFIHGWGGQSSDWHSHCKVFSESGFECHAIKLPSFELENPRTVWDVRDFALYVLERIDEEAPAQRVVIVGHSFGGRLGIYLAASFPERFSALVLSDSAGIQVGSLRKKCVQGASRMYKIFNKWNAIGCLVERARVWWVDTFGSPDYKKAEPFKRLILAKVVNCDLRPMVPKICCPTLIVWGGKDKTTPLWMAKWFQKNIRNSELFVIPAAGHQAFKTHSDEWMRRVRAFLRNLPPQFEPSPDSPTVI